MSEQVRHGGPASATESTAADAALREGLGALPVPETAPDFDARVLVMLRRRAPSETNAVRGAWRAMVPVLGGAAIAAALILAVHSWTLRQPMELAVRRSPRRWHDVVALEHLLERSDSGEATLGRLGLFLRRESPRSSTETMQRATPRQRGPESRSSRHGSQRRLT